jgi:hypothetical protein
VWLAAPNSWAAVNLAKVKLGQAIRHFALKGLSSNQLTSALTEVSRQHGIFVVDLASIGSQGFATNANAFCTAAPLAPGAVGSSALQSALQSAVQSDLRAQFARIHAHVLSMSSATIDGDPAVKDEITLTSAAGLTFSEFQYTVLSKAGRACSVTLATDNRAALRPVFNKMGGTIRVS